MTQRETWYLHFAISLAFCAPSVVFFALGLIPALYAAVAPVAMIGFAVGRERRDHEIKSGLPAKYWYRGWDFWNWSKDGQMDLYTFILPAALALVVILL